MRTERRRSTPAARKRVAVEMLAKHERSLRRTARRYSICADDADDALQRALEILLVKAPPGEARGTGPLDADGDQARGAGGPPRPRAAAGIAPRAARLRGRAAETGSP